MTDKELLLKYNLWGAGRPDYTDYTVDYAIYDEEIILKALRSAEERNRIFLEKVRAKMETIVEEIKEELGGK